MLFRLNTFHTDYQFLPDNILLDYIHHNLEVQEEVHMIHLLILFLLDFLRNIFPQAIIIYHHNHHQGLKKMNC
jgi:hypothetical protein